MAKLPEFLARTCLTYCEFLELGKSGSSRSGIPAAIPTPRMPGRSPSVSRVASRITSSRLLAGFNPGVTADTWNNRPTCTLRFAEVLAKIRASDFCVEELLYLFNGDQPDGCQGPLALQDPDAAIHDPLDLPEGDDQHSLWRLREALLSVRVSEEEACRWTWPEFVAELRGKFGYALSNGQDPWLSVGQHFFPGVLEASGFFSVSGAQRQYRTGPTGSNPTNWNTSPGGPFQYDSSTSTPALWTQLPLRDEAVVAKLSHMPELGHLNPKTHSV